TPQLIASIAGESLNLLPLTVTAAPDAIRTSVPPATQQAQTPTHVFSLPSRAALETESAPNELALAVAQPNVFPLKSGATPALAAAAVPPGLMQAAML